MDADFIMQNVLKADILNWNFTIFQHLDKGFVSILWCYNQNCQLFTDIPLYQRYNIIEINKIRNLTKYWLL